MKHEKTLTLVLKKVVQEMIEAMQVSTMDMVVKALLLLAEQGMILYIAQYIIYVM